MAEITRQDGAGRERKRERERERVAEAGEVATLPWPRVIFSCFATASAQQWCTKTILFAVHCHVLLPVWVTIAQWLSGQWRNTVCRHGHCVFYLVAFFSCCYWFTEAILSQWTLLVRRKSGSWWGDVTLWCCPLLSNRQHLAMMLVWRRRGKIIRTVLCCV